MCWKSQSPSTLDPASGPEHPPSRATSASPCAARPHRPRGPWARRPPGTYKQPQLTEEKKKRQKNKTPGISPSNPRPGQSTLCDNTPRHRSRLRSRLRSRAVKSPLQSRLPVPPTPPPYCLNGGLSAPVSSRLTALSGCERAPLRSPEPVLLRAWRIVSICSSPPEPKGGLCVPAAVGLPGPFSDVAPLRGGDALNP